MNNNIYVYILVASLVVYAIRACPLTLIQKNIKNKFIKSFLYYMPYVTLAVMTFPAILRATNNIISASIGFIVAIIVAYIDGNLFKVAISSCVTVFLVELIM